MIHDSRLECVSPVRTSGRVRHGAQIECPDDFRRFPCGEKATDTTGPVPTPAISIDGIRGLRPVELAQIGVRFRRRTCRTRSIGFGFLTQTRDVRQW